MNLGVVHFMLHQAIAVSMECRGYRSSCTYRTISPFTAAKQTPHQFQAVLPQKTFKFSASATGMTPVTTIGPEAV